MRRLLLLAFALQPLCAQVDSTHGVEFFEKKVRPIFAAKCYGCHGAKMQQAGLNLSVSADKFVVAGDPSQSRLFKAVSYAESVKMPPGGKLSDSDIATLREWIESGASWPKQSAAPTISSKRVITERDRQHWSFQPVHEPALPPVRDAAWGKSGIDRFILAKLEEKGIRPAEPASKTTLLRRVTYDLTGLPPTPAEIDAFVADQSADAYAKVIDRLLASPRYGERWGRLWLDVARFADSTGMDEDHMYPHAWRYRDYVVKAFNDDLPYDRFVKEQIAGDLLPTATREERERGIVATGFLALGPKPLAQQDRIQMIYDVVDEQIDTTSRAFMGLTVACARCHDHKFDPILTSDYYSMAAIFSSTKDFTNLGRPGSVSYIYYAPLDQAAQDKYQAHRWRMFGKQMEMEEAYNEDWTREHALMRPKIGAFLTAAWMVDRKGTTSQDAAKAAGIETKQAERWAAWLKARNEKDRGGYLKRLLDADDASIATVAASYQKTYEADAKKWDNQLDSWRKRFAVEAVQDHDLPARPKPDNNGAPFFASATFNGGPMEVPDSQRVALLRAEFKEFEKTLPPEPAMASAVTEGTLSEQHVFIRGDHNNPGEAVARTFPVVLAGEAQKPASKSSGRLELATWIASPTHPLTARVMVNRIWQGHFGEGLTRTPNNWGKMGDTPANPELLDYLAKRFVEGGWSIKSLHRSILLSNTYRMSSDVSTKAREADPANRLVSRFNRTRMSIEQIRDSLLAISGTLDSTIGGSLLTGKNKKDPDDSLRRTVYIPVRRGSVPALLSSFDFGDATTSGEGRSRSNVAPQALFMMNGRFVAEKSQAFAKALLDDASLNDNQRVERAYLMVLGRRPDASESDEALTYIAGFEKKLTGSGARLGAWESFCKVLIATNEFLYLN